MGAKLRINGAYVLSYTSLRLPMSFHNFLARFIRTVFITYLGLSLIGAFKLMEFKNKISQIDYQQKLTSLYI